MSLAGKLDSLMQRCAALGRDQRGVSAVEFAMILPLMVTLYLGTAEVSQGISIDRKVTLAAHAVSDLAAQATTINNTDMTNILDATTAVIAPYNASNLKITVSSVTIDANGKAKVDWSDTRNGSKRSGDVTSLIPQALRLAGTSLIWGEVTYAYKPAIGYVITGTMNLKDQLFSRPRLTGTVSRTTS